MPIESSHKITSRHIDRDAFLYVRQSSLRQVLENTESTNVSMLCVIVQLRLVGQLSVSYH